MRDHLVVVDLALGVGLGGVEGQLHIDLHRPLCWVARVQIGLDVAGGDRGGEVRAAAKGHPRLLEHLAVADGRVGLVQIAQGLAAAVFHQQLPAVEQHLGNGAVRRGAGHRRHEVAQGDRALLVAGQGLRADKGLIDIGEGFGGVLGASQSRRKAGEKRARHRQDCYTPAGHDCALGYKRRRLED